MKIGERGKVTHILNTAAAEPHVLCKSGKAAGRFKAGLTEREREAELERRQRSTQQLYRAEGEGVTCYRCIKLARLNLEKSRGKSLLP